MTFPDGAGVPGGRPPTAEPPTDDPPTTRLTPIRPGTRPPGDAAYGGTAPGAYGTATGYGPLPDPGARPPHPEPPAGRRRGRRTALLLAAAVLAGAFGGVCYGYAEQAGEPPTPLPPLNQPGLAYPEEPLPDDEAPAPLSAKQDRRVKTDGDLRKLLLTRPPGAVDAEAGPAAENWMAPYELAAGTGAAGEMLTYVLSLELRRTAFTAWATEQDGGGNVVMIYLFQFRNETQPGSVEFLDSEQMASALAGTEVRTVPLKGSDDGRAYIATEPQQEAGSPPLYQSVAVARRGDVVMEVVMMNTSPVAERDVTKLAERQLERL